MDYSRVNLHCHSIFSDGSLTPQDLADGLAAAGVGYASLTDHDSVDGLFEFQDALQKRHIGFIPGVEITTQFEGREIHILGYGIDPNHLELIATLHSLRQSQDLGLHSIATNVRKRGNSSCLDSDPDQNAAPDGRISIEDAISLIHRAHGLAFLAHPFAVEHDPEELNEIINILKSWGLDGLEVYYAPYSDTQRNQLEVLAGKHQLLMSGGTDAHAMSDPFTMSMPTSVWKKFRDAITILGANHTIKIESAKNDSDKVNNTGGESPRIYRRRYFIFRVLLPTLLAIILFVSMIWGMILPNFEFSLLERKRELIRELTNTAISVLTSFEQDERSGKLTRQEAQRLASSQIEALRYGRESKDYFWLQDMYPRIIMHPYRTDLNGQDVSQFIDPRGVRIFVEFTEMVRRKGEGYIAYVWQWKDDPQRIEAKESYIKGFEPWGWVIGTGIYIEDVKQEIARIERDLILVSLVISGGIILLLAFVVQQSLRIETQRRDMEQSLRESTDRYRSLIEATTEGTLLILDGRCRYANPMLMRLLNLTLPQLELMDLADILPREEFNKTAWDYMDHSEMTRDPGSFEGVLNRANGSQVDCILALNPISSGGLSGYILLAKEISARTNSVAVMEALADLAQDTPVGLFRAKAIRRAVLIDMNDAFHQLLVRTTLIDHGQPTLAGLFHEDDEFEAFMESLLKQEEVVSIILNLETLDASTITITLTARAIRDKNGQPVSIVGTVYDISAVKKEGIAKDSLIEKLQTSLLFLHEPVSSISHPCISCGPETTIKKTADLMTGHNTSAVLIRTENGAVIGMVTDHDMRERVLATGLDIHSPVRRIMSAPLEIISADALIYEALMIMEERGVQYLAVEDMNKNVVGVIRSKELVQFHRYGSIVITREINRAATPLEIANITERTPALVTALINSGGKPHNITHMLSSLCDATTERLIDLAIAELGEPPTEFTFIAMGSQGRQEQTLLTDQDNAIIYAPSHLASDQARSSDYFNRLGAQVSEGLAEAGFNYCRGQIMANNPRWCTDYSVWENYFYTWIHKAEPQELLESSIFFDFRPIYGNLDFPVRLRCYINAVLDEKPEFFPHLAQNSLLFKPPTRLPGRIYLGGKTEHPGLVDLKDAMFPIVNFARLYSLQHRVPNTNTLDRLEALVERKGLIASSRDDITNAYEFLMKLRLQHHLNAIQTGQPLDNLLQTTKISRLEDSLLQDAFAQISAVQKKITYDFLGGSAV